MTGKIPAVTLHKKNIHGQEIDTAPAEIQRLLHSRLMLLAFVLSGALLLFYVEGTIFNHPLSILLHGIALIVTIGCGVALAAKEIFSIAQLRMWERIVFTSILVFFSVHHFHTIATIAQESQSDEITLAICQMIADFLLLIVFYGLFIPNHWSRTAVIITPMALIPIIILFFLWNLQPDVLQKAPALTAWRHILRVFFYLALFVFSSVYSSRLLDDLSQEIFMARRVGQYRLIEKIGSGGMGEVWRAEHDRLVRPAAIKLIRHGLLRKKGEDSATAVRRFTREAQATAILDSPHTIEIYDFGVAEDGSFYYVMELLDGFNLDILVERFGPISPARAIYILKQACDSMAEAHQMKLVHRDIKPANIYICRKALQYDFVKVLDFGLVKKNWELPNISGKFLSGTPAFMAPEMAKNIDVDHRADIYGLGCVAYWLITGRLLFYGNSIDEIIYKHAEEQPLWPVEIDIPRELEKIIFQCLAKDREQRPQDVLALKKLLASCQISQEWSDDKANEWWQKHSASTPKS